MQIVEVSKRHFPQWLRLRHLLYPECSMGQLQEELEAIFTRRNVINELDYAVYAAELPDMQLCGLIEVSYRDDVEYAKNRTVGYIETLIVEEDQRRNGIAAALVDNGIRWVQKQRCGEILVDTDTIHPGACEFYESYGFKEIYRNGIDVIYKLQFPNSPGASSTRI